MRLAPEDKKYAYVTLIIGLGMFVLAILLSVSYCDFTFGNTSCPTPDASMGIGASIGAVTTALFFYFIDKPAKDYLAKFSKSFAQKDMLLIWLAAFVFFITSFALILPVSYCGFIFGDISCPAPDASIWMGAIVGVITTALFFFLISRRFNTVLEELGKLYIARTCVLNLMDIFGKENGKGRIKKSEHNRKYFQNVLKKDYLDRFNITSGIVYQIYEKATSHKDNTSNDHNSDDCNDCKEIMVLIKKFNSTEKNIIEDDSVIEKIDWMNRS
ncbi:hypothetical protein K0U27_08320 [archaeon]|nr:hypothetical protein [archaeon]